MFDYQMPQHMGSATAVLAICVMLSVAGGAWASDSGSLYGIHWWGYTQGAAIDTAPADMLNCPQVGGWDVETITATVSSGIWSAGYYTGLYADLPTNKMVSILTRIDYAWGQAVPPASNPDYSEYVSVVNTLKDGCHIWVIGNEPNSTDDGNGWPNKQIPPARYATIYRAVRNVIRNSASASPLGPHIVLIAPPGPADVGGAGGSCWMEGSAWLGQVLDNIPADEVDGFAMHAYGGSVSDFHSSYTQQLAAIDDKGFRMSPVYITEWCLVSTEQAMAQFVRDSYADVNTWNQGSGHHNIICLCWFIYDSDQQAQANYNGGWNPYSIEYYKNTGVPAGDPNDLYTAFKETAALRYPAGMAGTALTTMSTTPATFNHSIYAGDTLPNDIFTVQRTSGTVPLTYTVIRGAAWLSVSPGSGSSTGEANPFTMGYSVDRLTVGQYQAVLTIMADNATNSPQTVTVNLNVLPSPYAPADFDRDGDVDQSDFGLLQACLSGTGVAQTDPACAKAKLNTDNWVDRDDVLLFKGCRSGDQIAPSPTCVP